MTPNQSHVAGLQFALDTHIIGDLRARQQVEEIIQQAKSAPAEVAQGEAVLFSQFLSAVMDAAGLVRHGRQSKELSEYLGSKCIQYMTAALSAPSHGELVRHMVPAGWKLVPVEPTPEMLAAGDKYIGTPATYKAMLSACPSPAITKDFSQFLSAVMDAAGLIRHGRQSKELSEYLGMKCMEYRGAALSASSHGEQVRVALPKPLKRGDAEAERGEYGGAMARGYSAYERQLIRLNPGIAFAAAPSAGSQEKG